MTAPGCAHAQGTSSESPEEPSTSTHVRRAPRSSYAAHAPGQAHAAPEPSAAAAAAAAVAAAHREAAFPDEPDLEAEREEYEDEGSDGEEA